jgi:hypothetical protein
MANVNPKVFLGGSRKISRLPVDVQTRIDRIITKQLSVLVGDANGADKALQRYLHAKGFPHVEVFCSGPECRNNVGRWTERHIRVKPGDRGFSFYAAKDSAMAGEAQVGLLIWDRESLGTLVNAWRLVNQQKTAVVYLAPERRFVDVKTGFDVEALLARGSDDLRREFQRKAGTLIGRTLGRYRNSGIF